MKYTHTYIDIQTCTTDKKLTVCGAVIKFDV